MSQVLQYGVPQADWLLCENPICDERATVIATVKASPSSTNATGQAATQEVCGCATHISQLTTDRHVLKLDQLHKPGERNK